MSSHKIDEINVVEDYLVKVHNNVIPNSIQNETLSRRTHRVDDNPVPVTSEITTYTLLKHQMSFTT